jgi:aprataxin and PNK-like factor
VLEAKIKIKACHTNPIFYKISGTNQSQVLVKDSEIELKNLDKFSLLPNSEYEYEIKIQVDGDETEQCTVATSSTSLMRIRNANEINENLEAGNCPLSLSQIESSYGNIENNRVVEDLERTPSPDALVPPPDFVQPTQSSQSRKRSIGDEAEGGSKRSKMSEEPGVADTTSENSSNPTEVKVKPDPDAVPTSSTVSSSSKAPNIKPDPDGPSSTVKSEPAPTQNLPQLRPSCEFGIRCYRNTADHQREFAHPTDADYRRPNYPPAPSDAPDCPWGTACYRRNPDHFRALRHPDSSKKIY